MLEFNVFRKRPDPVFSVAMNKLRERPRRVKLPSPFVARLASCTYEIALHAVLLSEAVQSTFRKGEKHFLFQRSGFHRSVNCLMSITVLFKLQVRTSSCVHTRYNPRHAQDLPDCINNSRVNRVTTIAFA